MESIWSHFATPADEYARVGLLLVTVTGIVLSILILTHLLGPKRVGPIKHSPYESGMDPVGDTRRRFSVRFYLVAVLFLVFDVEVVFLYPWAVLYPRLRSGQSESWAAALNEAGYTPAFMLAAVGIFFALLLVGFVYEWRRGVFKWN